MESGNPHPSINKTDSKGKLICIAIGRGNQKIKILWGFTTEDKMSVPSNCINDSYSDENDLLMINNEKKGKERKGKG